MTPGVEASSHENAKTRANPTFALVGGLVQDGLGGHDLAIPFGHEITKDSEDC